MYVEKYLVPIRCKAVPSLVLNLDGKRLGMSYQRWMPVRTVPNDNATIVITTMASINT
jgi:hypothetical protein